MEQAIVARQRTGWNSAEEALLHEAVDRYRVAGEPLKAAFDDPGCFGLSALGMPDHRPLWTVILFVWLSCSCCSHLLSQSHFTSCKRI